MGLLEGSVTDFTKCLASPAPVPGGGSASALAGALGVALGDMVGELTVGKEAYAGARDELRALMARAQELRVRLLACVERDASAFEQLSKAYRIPKDDPARDEAMETCLRGAAAVPLEILELCCEAIELQEAFAEKGGRLVISDAATGAALCWGAMYGAAVNVKVNTKLMKDRAYAGRINARVDEKMDKYWRIAERVYKDIYNSFC